MTHADIPHVMSIEHSSFPDNPYPEETFKQAVDADCGVVADIGGTPAGYMLHRDDDKADGFRYGHSLAVHPDHRRAGLGESLMKHVMASYPNMSADVNTDNAPSRGMLKKLGFHTVRTFKEEGKRRHRMHRTSEEKQALTKATLTAEAAKTHTSPSEAQKESGNYKKGRVSWKGLTLVIETPKGGVRSGKSKDGKAWSTTMKDHYGYIAGTESGADGDAVDFFLRDTELDSELVFVVNQMKKDGTFDEHKCILGCMNLIDAKKTYLRNYSAGWTGMGEVTPITLDHFKWWLENADTSKEIKNGYFAAKANRKLEKKAADPTSGYSDPDEKETFDNADDEEELKGILAKKTYLGRYKCPNCGGTNLFNGIPGTGTTFRGSGHCQDCDEGCSIVGSKLKRIGNGPEIVMTDDQIASWRKRKRWERKHGYKKASISAYCTEYVPHMFLVKRASDEAHPFTIAVDLDGTLAEKEEPFDVDSIGMPIEQTVKWVRRFHKKGARIIIFTVRGDKDLVTDWLDEHEVPYDYVNENPDQPPKSSGKVFADVYWDDRAYNAEDPDEHGPEILRRVVAHGGDEEEETSSPVITIERRTVITITGPSLLEAMEDNDEHHDDPQDSGTE